MFKDPPKIYAHKNALKNGNFVTPEFILANSQNSLFYRFCPHRRYPMHEIGEVISENIVCNLHGFKWNIQGQPINNNRHLAYKKYTIGNSELIFQNFLEPDHKWVNDINQEKNLEFSHSYYGYSKGSWLWMMEIQTDLLHIRNEHGSIHPELSQIADLTNIKLDSGNNWAIQLFPEGWWLCIYPYTFIEYSLGCLAINYTVPENINSEYGFTWMSQFYFDFSTTDLDKRNKFEKYFQDVFLEDITAIEKQKGKYFPLVKASSKLENHCVHFGNWYKNNLLEN